MNSIACHGVKIISWCVPKSNFSKSRGNSQAARLHSQHCRESDKWLPYGLTLKGYGNIMYSYKCKESGCASLSKQNLQRCFHIGESDRCYLWFFQSGVLIRMEQ